MMKKIETFDIEKLAESTSSLPNTEQLQASIIAQSYALSQYNDSQKKDRQNDAAKRKFSLWLGFAVASMATLVVLLNLPIMTKRTEPMIVSQQPAQMPAIYVNEEDSVAVQLSSWNDYFIQEEEILFSQL